jgi:Uri superfamily endonuclease
LRWHADYLFSRHPATRAWLVDTELTECGLAARLRAALQGARPRDGRARRAAAGAQPTIEAVTERVKPAIVGFGASDCGCPGHLVAVERMTDLDRLLRSLPRRAAGTTRATVG